MVNWLELIEEKEDQILAEGEKAYKEAINNPHLRYIVEIDENGDVYSWYDVAGGNSFHVSTFEGKSKELFELCFQFLDIEISSDALESKLIEKGYKKELEAIQPVSDTTRAYLLVNIVEDNDKESLKILSESYLEKILEWVEPYRCRGVLAADLVQESNLSMMAYIGQKLWLNNYEWKDRIKEGSTSDILEVLKAMDKEVRYQAEESMKMLIDEQMDSNKISGKVLNKVNYVNDWAVRLRGELGRKPTVKEVAERMGVSEDVVSEALSLSADKIEDIKVQNEK